MTYHYTPEQETQVIAFVNQFITSISWMKEPAGVDSLVDKATLADGSISKEAMIRWFIQIALDSAQDANIHGEDLHDLIASAVLGWAKSSCNQDDRASLRPIYERYIT
jgi:hypothetical protein